MNISTVVKKKKYNEDKFKNAVLYIAKYGGKNVGQKKLAKLLYFVDFTLYELRKNSLTGMDYTKKDYGPMPEPIVFYDALGKLKEKDFIEIKKKKVGQYSLEKIVAKDEPDMGVFNHDEKEILKQTVKKYQFENGGTLEQIAQSEPPYKMVKYGEDIPFHLAFYRNNFGEMDLDD